MDNIIKANRNGPDALAQSNNELASEVFQDEFDRQIQSVRTDFDNHKEQQATQNNDMMENLNSLEGSINGIRRQVIDLKHQFDKNAKEGRFQVIITQLSTMEDIISAIARSYLEI